MRSTRAYNSPKREAQAAATREAILSAFAEQLSEGCERPSPGDAAARVGVSLRTVHVHFPNEESQIIAIGEWFDRTFHLSDVVVASGPDDLPRYYREIHAAGLQHAATRALAASRAGVWGEVRLHRRRKRLEAIRAAAKAVGAPKRTTEDATATLLALSGADASWALADHGLPLERIPDVIANTVELIVNQLKAEARKRPASRP